MKNRLVDTRKRSPGDHESPNSRIIRNLGMLGSAILGIVTVASLAVGYLQLKNQMKDSQDQGLAQATLMSILAQQVTIQSEMGTQQVLAQMTPGTTQEISATQVVMLQATLAALEKEKSLMDPINDTSGSGYLDVISTSIESLSNGAIRMEIRVNGDIPDSPSQYLIYVWGIDTDTNITTGYTKYIFCNDIGIDYLFRVGYANGRWNAWLDKAGNNGKAAWSNPISDFYISGNSVTVTIKLDLIESPTTFSWTVHTLEGTKYSDIAPNFGHFSFP
jgi:hypothetical protein